MRGVIDGDRWIAERLAFLRARLDTPDLSDAERQVVAGEIARLSRERGILPGGRRSPFGWFRRRLLR